MCIVRWDGLNKGATIGPWLKHHAGQHHIWFKAGTVSVYLTLNEADTLVNGIVDCLEEAKQQGNWPPPEPNR